MSSIFRALYALTASLSLTLPFSYASFQTDIITSLSHGAEVYLPGSEGFINASTRWSATSAPHFDVIVKVKTEGDVQQVIRYGNKHNKPFLAISGGHGTSSFLGNLQHGIGIWLTALDTITLVDNDTAALLGGGVQNGALIRTLWAAGKQTVTTGCDCVGYVAPVLGGGHGWLQGRYGLAADQLLEARVVLADGSVVTASDEENEELFWALRGAGHNFGIATQIKMRVYERDAAQDEWAASGFVFRQERLEDVFTIANGWLANPERPVQLLHYGVFAWNPEVDANHPIIIFWIYYQGHSIPNTYTDPLYALSPIEVDSSVTDLAGVNTHLMATDDGAACAKGSSRLLYPISLDNYSLPNLRTVFNQFATMSPTYRNSVVMLESYSTNRVIQIPSDSTAFPDRGSRLLVSPLLTYAANSSLDQEAFEIGQVMRQALLNGTGLRLNAYVNYARGDEKVEAVYGYEQWRLERLRKLKKEYDPFGRFNFYEPII